MDRKRLLDNEAQNPPTKSWKLPTGWRATITWAIVASSLVLVFNLVLLIWSTSRPVAGNNTREIVLGDCDHVSTIYTVWHIIINALSTILLAASNSCIQVLAAPTRVQIESAHARGTWLHIGVFSVRNLRSAGWKRILLVTLLALSSVPLHFFYNSAIVHKVWSWRYMVAGVHQDFLSGAHASAGICSGGWSPHAQMDAYLNQTQQMALSGQLDRLEWRDCISQLQAGYVPATRAVLLVSSTSNATMPVQGCEETYAGTLGSGSAGLLKLGDWMCSIVHNLTATCNFDHLVAGDTWTIPMFPEQTSWTASPFLVDHCLLAKGDQHCSADLVTPLMIAVIACNAVKLGCFIYTLFFIHFEPLVTLGDATAAFLLQEDRYSKNLGPLGWEDIRMLERSAKGRPRRRSNSWSHRLLRLRVRATSLVRWTFTTALCMVLLIVASVLLAHYVGPGYLVSWNWDFLTRATSGNWVDMPGGEAAYDDLSITGGAALVNLPQFLVSAAYLIYNSTFTSICSSVEYCRYATQAKALRVSNPVGEQRSTYWLSLPYRYSLPLMFIMFVLHWMISQSLYLVFIQLVGPVDVNGNDPLNILTAAWNPSAATVCIVLGLVMVLFLLITGLRKMPSGMPIMGSCSLAIAAACHRRPDEGPEIAEGKLRYGSFHFEGQQSWVGFTGNIDEVEYFCKTDAMVVGGSEEAIRLVAVT